MDTQDLTRKCNFWAQMEHLRFSRLFQWGHLRHAFQGIFQLWEVVVVLKRTESLFGGFWRFTLVEACL